MLRLFFWLLFGGCFFVAVWFLAARWDTAGEGSPRPERPRFFPRRCLLPSKAPRLHSHKQGIQSPKKCDHHHHHNNHHLFEATLRSEREIADTHLLFGCVLSGEKISNDPNFLCWSSRVTLMVHHFVSPSLAIINSFLPHIDPLQKAF